MPYANVNRVYQAILSLADKQGHGYIGETTFNRFAPLAQLAVFDDLIEEFKLHRRNKLSFLDPQGAGGRQQTLDDLSTLYENGATLTSSGGNNVFQKPSNFGYLINVNYNDMPIDILDGTESALIRNNYKLSGRGCATHAVLNGGSVTVYPPTVTADVTMDYYRIPRGIDASGNVSALGVLWNATTVGNNSFYDASTSNNFELPETCEHRLVLKLGAMVGLNIRDVDVVNYAELQEQKETNEQ